MSRRQADSFPGMGGLSSQESTVLASLTQNATYASYAFGASNDTDLSQLGQSNSGFCHLLQDKIPLSYLHTSMSTLIFGGLQILTSFVVILFLYCLQSYYTRGQSIDSGATHGGHSQNEREKNTATVQRRQFLDSVIPIGHSKSSLLILPVYRWALWGLAFTDLVQGITNVFIELKSTGGNSLSTSLIFGFAWGSYHFVLEGLAFLLMQQGCGRFALRRTLCAAAVWALVVFVTQSFSFYCVPNTMLQFLSGFIWDAGLFMFYSFLALCPAGILPCMPIVRPALVRIYAPFWSIFHLTSCASLILEFYDYDVGLCVEMVGVLLPFAAMKPFVVYFTLRADSQFWMGLGSQNDPLQQPLLGSHLPADCARELAQQLDTSVTRGVRMLEPSLLKIDSKWPSFKSPSRSPKKNILGIGGSARVYAATYRGHPCAAKLVFLPEITANTVRALCNEASLLSAVDSPHVMKVLGICVRPPSIFLVSEMVRYGSLFDIIHVQGAQRKREEKLVNTSSKSSDASGGSRVRVDGNDGLIKPLPISSNLPMALRIHLAIGCAEAIHILHSQSPPVVHGDIKSQNFLLGEDFLVKVADLELASRCFQGGRDVFANNPFRDNIVASIGGDTLYTSVGIPSPASAAERSAFMARANGINKLRRLSQSLTPSDPDYRIPEVANWLAPEVLDGHAQSPRSDVYSLAMTIFEIFTDSVPFSHLELSSKFKGDELKHHICAKGARPVAPEGASLPLPILELLERMWSADRSQRPDTASVVRSLRGIAGKLLFGELNVLHYGDDNNKTIGAQIEASGLCACLLDCRPPFCVQYATQNWQNACGWKVGSIVGKTLTGTLCGPLTNPSRMATLKQALALGDFHFSGNVHYSEDGEPFLHLISVSPLTSSVYMTPPSVKHRMSLRSRVLAPRSARLRRATSSIPRPGQITRVATVSVVRRQPQPLIPSPASSPIRSGQVGEGKYGDGWNNHTESQIASGSPVLQPPSPTRASTPPPLRHFEKTFQDFEKSYYSSASAVTPPHKRAKLQSPKFLVRSMVVNLT